MLNLYEGIREGISMQLAFVFINVELGFKYSSAKFIIIPLDFNILSKLKLRQHYYVTQIVKRKVKHETKKKKRVQRRINRYSLH